MDEFPAGRQQAADFLENISAQFMAGNMMQDGKSEDKVEGGRLKPERPVRNGQIRLMEGGRKPRGLGLRVRKQRQAEIQPQIWAMVSLPGKSPRQLAITTAQVKDLLCPLYTSQNMPYARLDTPACCRK